MANLSEIIDQTIEERMKQADEDLTNVPDPVDLDIDNTANSLNDIYAERLVAARNVVKNYSASLNTVLVAARAYRDTLYDYTNKVKALAETQTFLRKSYFLHLEHDSMVAYSAYATLFIWANAVVYGKVAIFDYKAIKNINAWIGFVFILTSPFFLVILLQIILQIPKRVNIYSTWLSDGRQEWHGD